MSAAAARARSTGSAGQGDPCSLTLTSSHTLTPAAEPWEGGDGNTAVRFTGNPDCAAAYRNFLCYMNFPRCDDTGRSLALCRSVCENLVTACKYGSSMSRCYNPEFYGAKDAEPDTLTDAAGLPIYLRAHFPGQPFTDNLQADDDAGTELVVCTPSIKGAAPPGAALAAWAVALALAAVVGAAGGRAGEHGPAP